MRHTLLTLAIATLGTVSATAGAPATHKVRRGETAAAIARKAGLSMADLQDLNPRLNLAKLSVGTSLKVRGTKPAARVAEAGPRLDFPPVGALPATPALGPNAPLAHLERMLPASPRLSPPKPLNAESAGSLAEATPTPGASRITPVLPAPTGDEAFEHPQLQRAMAFEPADPAHLDLLWPVETRTVSSNWGPRMRTRTVRVKNQRKKRVRYKGRHRGVDLNAPAGTDVYAALDGVVLTSGRHRQYGNYVVLDHGNGVTTLYAHHRANLVSEGDVVHRGQKIAEVGRTGNATGPHLHFELKVDGVHQNPLPALNDLEEIPADLVAHNALLGSRD